VHPVIVTFRDGQLKNVAGTRKLKHNYLYIRPADYREDADEDKYMWLTLNECIFL
jgi:hypothetical protein